MLRRLIMLIIAIAFVPSITYAQSASSTYPVRRITIIVPTGAGSAPDVLTRKIGEVLSNTLRKPVVVENKPGAAGILGANAVAQAAPDGYTLLMAWDGMMCINPILYPSLSYDPQKNFTPISAMGRVEFVLVANPSFAPNNLPELIALAKANPGKINYGSAGVGEVHHIAMAAIAAQADIRLVHVPYAGGPAELNDIVADHVPIGFIGLTPAMGFLKSGRLKALAVLGDKRLAELPSVPTVAETLPGFSIQGSWLGLFAPAGTPNTIINKLNRMIIEALKKPEISTFLVKDGVLPMGTSPEEFRKLIQNDTARFREVIQKADIRIR
jgi:tripartite-type tricarboxylate transporter receptor subunit TctC